MVPITSFSPVSDSPFPPFPPSLLPPNVLGILSSAYPSLTPVQSVSMPLLLGGSNLLSSSPTGTGKTLAYAVAAAVHASQGGGTRALVLLPTREIVIQVEGVMKIMSECSAVRAVQQQLHVWCGPVLLGRSTSVRTAHYV